MALNEGIQSLAKLEIELRDAYLNRIIDFLKWTSTFAILASLWIGTNFDKFVEPTSKAIIEKQNHGIGLKITFLPSKKPDLCY